MRCSAHAKLVLDNRFVSPPQIDSKNDPVRQAEAREWLQAVVGEPFPEGTLQEALKDGTYLCKAIEQLNPGYKIKLNKLKTPFAMVRVQFATGTCVATYAVVILHGMLAGNIIMQVSVVFHWKLQQRLALPVTENCVSI